ncbi:DUF4142 domain-containing protein [Methylobacterium oxalidis]|uniref:DUF4142 domain-containing protein n=1 Tax=Methylobacterium oxalidis TaxID=944322 RepID=A0ABQ6DIC3_9HYPH|nr:DUF4142 domain-containing protein [Methylobacterium oxalidis]GLS64649.1 hypothetical protein GCM10007888_30300 [Methylobacterium oxalidis]
MDRRRALTAVVTALAIPTLAASAFAQNSPSSVSEKSGNTAAAMGEAEAKHAGDTSTAGLMSLETSRIALKKAQHPKVKEFAQLEVAEQETIADVLRASNKTGFGALRGDGETAPSRRLMGRDRPVAAA